jgi:pSer/pThr/pTyr-binding forkhead associated (FHA) protein
MAGIEVHLSPLTFPEPPTIAVSDESFLIGREAQVFNTWKDARLKRLSREHARLQIKGDAASLCDLGSTNGTKINNVPLIAFQVNPLRDGDVITFANVLKYEVKIVRHESADDTLVTRQPDDPIDDNRIVDQTLFPSSDSFLDMLCDDSEPAYENPGQPVPEKKPRHWMVLTVVVVLAIAAAIAGYFIYFGQESLP